MKRMVLSTLMCVILTASLTAQTQDTVKNCRVKRDVPQREMRTEKISKDKIGKRTQRISPEQCAKMRANFLQKKLTLNDGQTEQLSKVFLAESMALREKRSSLDSVQIARREAFKAVKLDTNKQIKQVLTEEQYTKYSELEVQHKNHANRPNGRKGHAPHNNGKHHQHPHRSHGNQQELPN